MSSKLLTYCLMIFIATTNCVEPYDFQPKEASFHLVVDGGVTQADDINRIRLTASTQYSTTANARVIENAEIKLLNSKSEFEYLIYEEDGYYAHCGESLKIVVGESYYIEIKIGNKNYRSDPQTLAMPIDPDSITYEVGHRIEINPNGNEVTYENINIFIHTPINTNGENSYLRWKTDESWSFTEKQCNPLIIPKTCYMAGKINDDEIFIYSAEAITGTYLSDKLVAYKTISDRVEFIERHYFNVHQYILTKEAYDYWEKVVQIAHPSGDIFDLPPAPLSGNVYNINDKDEIVLGYFEVAAKSIVRIPLFRSDISPFAVPTKNYICWRTDYANVCCNCTAIESSTTERPDYW